EHLLLPPRHHPSFIGKEKTKLNCSAPGSCRRGRGAADSVITQCGGGSMWRTAFVVVLVGAAAVARPPIADAPYGSVTCCLPRPPPRLHRAGRPAPPRLHRTQHARSCAPEGASPPGLSPAWRQARAACRALTLAGLPLALMLLLGTGTPVEAQALGDAQPYG